MARDELQIVAEITGNATRELNAIAGASDKVTKQSGFLKGALGSAFGIFTGQALIGGISAAAGAVGGFLSDSMSNAGEAQEAIARIDTAIGNLGDQAPITSAAAQELASSLSAAAGASRFGDEAILDSITTLTRFQGIGEEVFPRVGQLAVDMATQLGTEPTAAAAVLGKALDQPAEGFAKLSRMGINFTVDQEAAIKKMVEGGDAAGAQALMLSVLEERFAGAGQAAAGTFAGQMDTLRDRIGEAQETIGLALMPAIQALTSYLSSPEGGAAIAAFADALSSGIGGAVTFLTGTAMPALQGAIDLVIPAFAFLAEHANSIAPVMIAIGVAIFSTTVPALWAQAAAATASAAATIAAMAPILPIVAAVGLAAGLLAAAWANNWGDIQGKTEAVLGFLRDTVWPWLQNAFAQVASVLLPALSAAWEVAWPAIQAAVNTVYVLMKDVIWPWIFQAFGNLKTWIEDVRGVWDTKVGQIRDIIRTIDSTVDEMRKLVQDYVENLKDYFTAGWDTVKTAVQTTWDVISGYISGPINAAKDAVNIAISVIKTVVQSGIDKVNALIGAINSIPGIPDLPTVPGGSSPQTNRVAMQGGRLGATGTDLPALSPYVTSINFILEALKGIKGGPDDARKKALDFVKTAIDVFQAVGGLSKLRAPTIDQGVIDRTVTSMQHIADSMITMLNELMGPKFVKEIPERLKAWADTVDGVLKVVGSTLGLIGGFSQRIVSPTKEQIGILGDTIGRMIRQFASIADTMDAEMLDAAKVFASSGGAVAAVIKPGIDGLLALTKGIADIVQPTNDQLWSLSQAIGLITTQFGSIGRAIGTEVLEAAQTVADTVSAVFDVIAGAQEAIGALSLTTLLPTGATERFLANIREIATMFDVLTSLIGPQLSRADTWRDSMQALADAVTAGGQAITGVASGQGRLGSARNSMIVSGAGGSVDGGLVVNIAIDARGADSSVEGRIRAMIPEIAQAINAGLGRSTAALGRGI